MTASGETPSPTTQLKIHTWILPTELEILNVLFKPANFTVSDCTLTRNESVYCVQHLKRIKES